METYIAGWPYLPRFKRDFRPIRKRGVKIAHARLRVKFDVLEEPRIDPILMRGLSPRKVPIFALEEREILLIRGNLLFKQSLLKLSPVCLYAKLRSDRESDLLL